MEPISDADQLRGHAHLLAIAAHAAFDNVAHAELAPDLAHIAAFALELEDRGACDDLELRHLGEHVQEFFGHAVREIILVGFAAHVGKGQDGDRITISHRRRGHIAFSERWLAIEIPTQCQHDEHGSGSEETLAARRLGIELYALARDIKNPRHHDRDRKTEQCDQNKNAQSPRRRIEGRKSDRGGLHCEPRHNKIGCADLEDLAALELAKKVVDSHCLTSWDFASNAEEYLKSSKFAS